MVPDSESFGGFPSSCSFESSFEAFREEFRVYPRASRGQRIPTKIRSSDLRG